MSFRTPRLQLAVFALLTLLAALPASASATDRYASPTGSGSACTSATPCSLEEAYNNNASAANDVIVLPGTYGSPGSPLVDFGTTGTGIYYRSIHGVAGQPRPTIYVTSSIAVNTAFANRYGTTKDLDIVVVAGPATDYGLVGSSGLISRVSVSGNATQASCTGEVNMDNVVCANSSAYGDGIIAFIGGTDAPDPVQTFNFTYRNVTAISQNGTALENIANTGVVTNITATNSIFRGGGSNDIHATTNGVNGAGAHVFLDHSNYEHPNASDPTTSITAAGSGTNQTSAPLFVNAGGGDFHQATGSPTIDAGLDDALNGSFDLDYNARIQGARTDIGAFEFAPPATPGVNPPTVYPPAFGKFKLASTRFKAAKGTRLSFDVSTDATVTITLQRQEIGRKVKSRCAKTTRSNRKLKKCKRWTALKGSTIVDAKAGPNSTPIITKRLKPGKYKLTAKPKAGTLTGSAQSASFTVLR